MATTTISFSCPNGHPLSCGRELVGKAGKCPKCGAKFLVPEVPEEEDAAPAEEPEAKADAKNDKKADSKPDSGNGADPPLGPGMIVFLCPNGHRLNGPSRLAGKAGQCPHCNAKFLIPSLEEMAAADEAAEDGGDEGGLVSKRASDSAVVGQDTLDELEEVEDFPEEPEEVDLQDGEIVISPSPPGSHPLSYVLARIWAMENASSDVELFLENGDVLAPELFARDLSYSGYGVFATENDDGSFSITTLPWEKITRIAFRKVKKLPPNLFQ